MLGELFGLRRRERIAYLSFTKKNKNLSEKVHNSLQKPLDLGGLGESFCYFVASVVVPFPKWCQGRPLERFWGSPVTFLGALGIPWAPKTAQSDSKMDRKSMFFFTGSTFAAQLAPKGSH